VCIPRCSITTTYTAYKNFESYPRVGEETMYTITDTFAHTSLTCTTSSERKKSQQNQSGNFIALKKRATKPTCYRHTIFKAQILKNKNYYRTRQEHSSRRRFSSYTTPYSLLLPVTQRNMSPSQQQSLPAYHTLTKHTPPHSSEPPFSRQTWTLHCMIKTWSADKFPRRKKRKIG
jgi:hypothetical protein